MSRIWDKGFTLIEIMVVIAIVGGMIAMAIPYLTNRNKDVRGFLRQVIVLSRQLHTQAKLNGVAYRLVIDMGEPGDGTKQPEHRIFVERASGKVVLKENEEEAALALSRERDEEARKDPRGFAEDNSLIKEPLKLPRGLRVDQVELTRMRAPLRSGRAFIHYLPQGLVDEAAIQIKGEGKMAWTISIHPLTGRAELISKEVDLREIREQ